MRMPTLITRILTSYCTTLIRYVFMCCVHVLTCMCAGVLYVYAHMHLCACIKIC